VKALWCGTNLQCLGVHPCEDGLAKVYVGSRRSGGPGLLAGDHTILIGALVVRRGSWRAVGNAWVAGLSLILAAPRR
jgi:hypothetical protein